MSNRHYKVHDYRAKICRNSYIVECRLIQNSYIRATDSYVFRGRETQ